MDKIRVLLIDDEEELVSTLMERLAIRDVEADWVVSGAEALETLKQKTFDAVVLDVKMPGLGGLEVMKIIKEKYAHVKILLITGQGALDEEIARTPPEAYDVLLKPINIEILVQKLTEAVSGDQG